MNRKPSLKTRVSPEFMVKHQLSKRFVKMGNSLDSVSTVLNFPWASFKKKMHFITQQSVDAKTLDVTPIALDT